MNDHALSGVRGLPSAAEGDPDAQRARSRVVVDL